MSTDPLSKARDPLIGTRIDNRYLVTGVLGRGGMGVVYEGVHEQLGRPVAIKVLAAGTSGDPLSVQRFLREAQTASQLTHGNIVDVSDLGVLEDGRPFLVMARIQGTDLATLLEMRGPQTPRRTVELLEGAAAALDLIHAKGFVHRDVKPENLMYVVREDGSETTLLLDFGIVGLVSGQSARLTAEGSVFGTPAYLAPEVIQGALPDRRADVYALATVAFELMAGRPPFEAENPLRILPMKIMNEAPRLTNVCRIPFSTDIEDVVARGLTREPEPRWPSAGEFIAALDAAVLAHEEDTGEIDPRSRTGSRRAATPARLRAPPLKVPPPRGVTAPMKLDEELLRTSVDSAEFEAVLRRSLAPAEPSLPDPPPPPAAKDTPTELIQSGSGTLSIELEASDLEQIRGGRPRWVGIGIGAGALLGALALIGHFALRGGDADPDVSPRESSSVASPEKPPEPKAAEPAAPVPAVPSQPTEVAAAPAAPEPSEEPPSAAPSRSEEPPSAAPSRSEEPPSAAPSRSAPAQASPRSGRSRASKPASEPRASAKKGEPAADVPPPVITVTPAPKAAGKTSVSASELVQAAARELIQGHLSAAADLYSQAARIDPKNEAAFRGLGLANERLGRKTEAIRAFNRALTLAPNGQNAAMLRARLAKLQGNP